MNNSLIARGGVPVQLDRERIVLFDMQATGLLNQKYGMAFWQQLFETDGKGLPKVKDITALQFFLWAGLLADAEIDGEKLTLEQVSDFIRPMTLGLIASAVSIAVTFQFSAPGAQGKAEAVAASPADTASEGKGGRKVSTMPKRKASR